MSYLYQQDSLYVMPRGHYLFQHCNRNLYRNDLWSRFQILVWTGTEGIYLCIIIQPKYTLVFTCGFS